MEILSGVIAKSGMDTLQQILERLLLIFYRPEPSLRLILLLFENAACLNELSAVSHTARNP